MKGLLITHPGCEDIASLEIKELIGQKAQKHPSCISFNIKSYLDLCKLCYLSQSAIKVLCLLNEGKVDNLQELIGALNLKEWVNKKTSVAARCKAIGSEHQSLDIERIAGEALVTAIKKNQGFKPKVDLTDPDVTVFVYIYKDQCYIGIDFAGFDISKRSYKIFSHASAIKGTIGYALLRYSGYKKGDILVDPFSGSATIAIEAALYTMQLAVNFFSKKDFVFTRFLPLKDVDFSSFFSEIDKNKKEPDKSNIYAYDFLPRYVDAGKKNAKIAGVEKNINFARVEVEWIDLKFDKESIDCIVTNPPRLTAENEKKTSKIYNELFYQAALILNPKGNITLISTTPEKVREQATKHNFSLSQETVVWQGKEKIFFITFKKKR